LQHRALKQATALAQEFIKWLTTITTT
jgi:hypothetical protein